MPISESCPGGEPSNRLADVFCGDALKKRSFLAARTTLALAAAAALGATTLEAQALGLGRLNVQSALGEVLRAEIDITTLTPEEASTLSVRVAGPDAYRAAGVEYNSVLAGTQAVLARRADGRAYLRVQSDRVVQEPFLDVILELTWSTGRLVREFTLLVDPPNLRTAPPTQAAAPALSPAPMPSGVPAAPAPRAPAPPAVAAAPRPAPAPAPRPAAAGSDEYQVRPGDTLSGIAGRTLRPGVSLDQMLVGLYRSNPDAFIRNNINRLRSGVVLSVPTAEQAKAVTPSQAREIIVAQSADFGSYRSRLAEGAPAATTDGAGRQAGGKVQASVQERNQAGAPSPDKLRLSGAASAPETQVSQATQRRDAAAREAEVARNVQDLKNLQKGVAAAASAPAPAPAPAPVAAAPAPAPTAPAVAVAPPPVVASAPAPAPAPTDAASAPTPPAPTLSASRPVAPLPAPAPEPSFLDSIVASQFALPGAGVLALVLAGLAFYKYRSRQPRKERTETSFLESRVQPDSFFGASGGQRVDTTDQSAGTSSMGFSLSQLDAIGDVDPVAEADVYLAYGRDLQAEEILKEAMRTTPDRLAIRTKLLEVYAKRRDTKGFELLATQLFAITQGAGADWEKAQEMGRGIDPENPLYQSGGRPAEMLRDGQVIAEPLSATTLPQSVLPSQSVFPGDAAPTLPAATPDVDLDLDLDLDTPSAAAPLDMGKPPAAAANPASRMDLDFDFANEPVTVSGRPGAPAPAPSSMDFNLDDLSLDLTAPLPREAAKPAPAPAPNSSLDFGDFTLPLPSADDTLPVSSAAQPELGPDDADPIARKLELAEEFRQIGDMEGARDLLEEVIAKSSGSLKAKAQGMLDELG
jgi:pilus assembly protein FimV